MSDELEPLRRLRPDNVLPDDPGDPTVLSCQKEQLMSTIAQEPETTTRLPDLFPRLAYSDEFAALDYLVRVLGFTELREARMEHEWDGRQQMLAWLRLGAGIVMIGHANHDVHRIYSPSELGHTTVIMHLTVHDIDSHYARAVARGCRRHDGAGGRVLRRAALRGDRSRGPPVALRRESRGDPRPGRRGSRRPSGRQALASAARPSGSPRVTGQTWPVTRTGTRCGDGLGRRRIPEAVRRAG